LKEFFSMGTDGIDRAQITLRFAHFGAALTGLEKKPIHRAHTLAGFIDDLLNSRVRHRSDRPLIIRRQ
jgi:hypothetical protein